MEPYDVKSCPGPFGLNNSGSICHFNSLLQAIASCPTAVNTVLSNKDYMQKTNTGTALYAFMDTMINKDARGIERCSSQVLNALMKDLAERRKTVNFGMTQESASEGLVLLLDMIEPPGETNHPLTYVFMHKYQCNTACLKCKTIQKNDPDYSVQFDMFRTQDKLAKISSVKEFTSELCAYVADTTNFSCETCKTKVAAKRVYSLRSIPEIAVCLFNIYRAQRMRKFIPRTLEIPYSREENKLMIFERVAFVEQTGSLAGGHYTASGMRNDGKFYHFNDSATPSVKTPAENGNENVYLAFFHFVGIRDLSTQVTTKTT